MGRKKKNKAPDDPIQFAKDECGSCGRTKQLGPFNKNLKPYYDAIVCPYCYADSKIATLNNQCLEEFNRRTIFGRIRRFVKFIFRIK